MGYEHHMDTALIKPTQERWLKLQDLIIHLKSKHVLTARCLMLLIRLLASMEKMVREGRLHMRPFQFHNKEHWRYPQSLDSLLSSPRPKCLGHRYSKHKLVGHHCLCLPSNGSPSQGDPKNKAIQLPDHSQTVPQLCVSQ